MNTSTEATKATDTSLTRDWINLARYYVARYLGGRRGLIMLTLAALAVGLALNWSWLVAIGVAPLLIALAPCAAMCALGLCMSRMGGQSRSGQSPTRGDADVPTASSVSSEALSAPVAGEGEERGAALPGNETASDRS